MTSSRCILMCLACYDSQASPWYPLGEFSNLRYWGLFLPSISPLGVVVKQHLNQHQVQASITSDCKNPFLRNSSIFKHKLIRPSHNVFSNSNLKTIEAPPAGIGGHSRGGGFPSGGGSALSGWCLQSALRG